MNFESAHALQRHEEPTIQDALQAYAQEIERLEKDSNPLSKQQILQLLLVRDDVEESLQTLKTAAIAHRSEVLARLSDLDSCLQTHTDVLTSDNKLAACRQSHQPPEAAWWWWLEPETPEPTKHKLDRFDWLWNLCSAGCLVVSASYLTITGQAFSAVGGFDLLQTLSTVSQATGLVLIAGGALTDKGQKVVQNTLAKLNIPPHFHSEVTLGASALLLLASYGVYNSLPQLSQHYYQKGLKAKQNGNLYAAIEHFQEAIAFNPNDSAPHTHLAEVYQNLEQFPEAEAEYQDGLLKGDITALNGMGMLSLAAAEEATGDLGELSGLLDAEVLFRIGLNQVESENNHLKAILHTNLGVTLMKRSKAEETSGDVQQTLLTEAGEHFQEAIRLEESFIQGRSGTYAGQGVAYCFLADIYEQTDEAVVAAAHWQTCEAEAYPASLEQYEDILRLGGSAIGLHLNTKHILETNLD